MGESIFSAELSHNEEDELRQKNARNKAMIGQHNILIGESIFSEQVSESENKQMQASAADWDTRAPFFEVKKRPETFSDADQVCIDNWIARASKKLQEEVKVKKEMEERKLTPAAEEAEKWILHSMEKLAT